MCVTAE